MPIKYDCDSYITETTTKLLELHESLINQFGFVFKQMRHILTSYTKLSEMFWFTHYASYSLHGVSHWYRVAVLAVYIVKHGSQKGKARFNRPGGGGRHSLSSDGDTGSSHEILLPPTNPLSTLSPLERAALLAGAFHDSCRASDSSRDPHGRRVARFIRVLLKDHPDTLDFAGLTAGQWRSVVLAVSGHDSLLPWKVSNPKATDIITQALCNADRFDRIRFSPSGPSPRYLFNIDIRHVTDMMLERQCQAPRHLLTAARQPWAQETFLQGIEPPY
eukprot:gnl/Dysnectes_brevis/6180_a9388_404.p1 GENE.gnl/Dysnectes_brevis/6180_a9388_404~~gnl/Dysnectes_brevis/6180_a9388_404.p1  ORF type:complete len:275 (-),score=36.24 gnl/Dysnectes_brevis/6180_a9388_404:73-897(-)